jgi:hypothetical protein
MTHGIPEDLLMTDMSSSEIIWEIGLNITSYNVTTKSEVTS